VRTRMGKGPKVSNWDDWKHFGLEIRRKCLEPRLGREFASCCGVNLVGGAGGIAALGSGTRAGAESLAKFWLARRDLPPPGRIEKSDDYHLDTGWCPVRRSFLWRSKEQTNLVTASRL
jgi:hypothetical protein